MKHSLVSLGEGALETHSAAGAITTHQTVSAHPPAGFVCPYPQCVCVRPSPRRKTVQDPMYLPSLESRLPTKPEVKRLAFDFVLLGGGGNFYRWAQKEEFWDKDLKGAVHLGAFPLSRC